MTCEIKLFIQGAKDAPDALSCRYFSAKRAIHYKALLRANTYKFKVFYVSLLPCISQLTISAV